MRHDRPHPLPYSVVGTGQTRCHDDVGPIAPPGCDDAFYGQDAQQPGPAPRYALGADGLTVHDERTGLTWTRSPRLDGVGPLRASDKLGYAQACALPQRLNAARYGGYDDWRLPTVKALYSLILFSGADVCNLTDPAGAVPFIDTRFFGFAYGDAAAGERAIDAQWATSTLCVANPALMFGVNFADGRIKGYPVGASVGKTFFVSCVRGNPAYGDNDFTDLGDGRVLDRATGLMWSRDDSGVGMNWRDALAWVRQCNARRHLGHADWRLPDAKELHSIVDYTRAPQTTGTPAIDPVFRTSALADGEFPYFWSSTTHQGGEYDGAGGAAVYVAFGRALGWGPLPDSPPGTALHLDDVHGAGAQRSDPKSGDPARYPHGRGPQGDVIRIVNHVRLVRHA